MLYNHVQFNEQLTNSGELRQWDIRYCWVWFLMQCIGIITLAFQRTAFAWCHFCRYLSRIQMLLALSTGPVSIHCHVCELPMMSYIRISFRYNNSLKFFSRSWGPSRWGIDHLRCQRIWWYKATYDTFRYKFMVDAEIIWRSCYSDCSFWVCHILCLCTRHTIRACHWIFDEDWLWEQEWQVIAD